MVKLSKPTKGVKKMKKLLCFILSLILSMTIIVGCDKKDDLNNESSKAATASAEDFTYEKNEDGGITIKKYIGDIAHVQIPDEIDSLPVTTLGYQCFKKSKILKSVVIPDTVTTIKADAFLECSLLESVVFSQNLKTIEANAFQHCKALAKIDLPESLVIIAGQAFFGCVSLEEIAIPKNVKTLAHNVFGHCEFKSIVFLGEPETIGGAAFANNPYIEQIVLPNSVKNIENIAFANCENLKKIVLNEGLISIGDSAFRRNPNLTEIVIPKTVETINETAFLECPALKSVKFEGNAPAEYKSEKGNADYPEYTVYYHDGAKGFTSPEWCGYKTEKW